MVRESLAIASQAEAANPALLRTRRELVLRLQKELPSLGYPSVTPAGNETPIVAYQLKDAAATAKKLRDAKVTATIIESEKRMRLAVSVFNNQQDIDRLLNVLG